MTKKISKKDIFQNEIVFHGIKTHNLKNIDITLPKNKIITVTGVSGSWKSSFAFHTLYKEWQFRYIESLSSYLRQFFNLWTRPDLESSSWLSPAIAIEQNKNVWNSRSTLWTLTEIDDYLRLLLAKTWKPYSYGTWLPMESQNIDTIIQELYAQYQSQKVFLLKESKELNTPKEFDRFIKNNRAKVEKGKWFTRYLAMSISDLNKENSTNENESNLPPIEFFYLEDMNIPEKYFPIKLFGIFDRVTIEEQRKNRLKEDIIKILADEKKFGVYAESDNIEWNKIKRFTDKNYCPVYNISYPKFSPQHFSFNRAEWACPNCHWIGEILQVDFEKVIDANSPYTKAILPWRDSRLGQTVLLKLAQKYSMDEDKKRSDLPERFRQVVIDWDNELIRINLGGKYSNIKYKWIEEILKDQYNEWVLTVDFQTMLEMRTCPSCEGAKLRKESLHVFLTIPDNTKNKKIIKNVKKLHTKVVDENKDWWLKINIAELQTMTISQIVSFLRLYKEYSSKNKLLIDRIIKPLIDRVETIEKLWLSYLTPNRWVKTLSWGELQRLRLAKQLWNKLTWIVYVLDEPTIGLSEKEIKRTIEAIKTLKDIWNTIVVVEHNEDFIKASDWIVEIWPWAWDFWWELIFNGEYKNFIQQKSLTSDYINGIKKIEIDFTHKPYNKFIQIKKANKHNLQNIDVEIQLWSFTIITWHSWAWKTTLMYDILFRFLQEKEKFIQWYIRLQLLKQWMNRKEIVSAPVMNKEKYENYKNIALQEFYKDIWVETIMWVDSIDQVLYVDQSNIGKTPRSCPSTFIWVFDEIRKLYTWVNEARYLWFNAWHFSFNSNKGACPECKWYWYKKIELQFLPDTYVPCELCNWKRYKPEILEIKRRWKNISEVLSMYVNDALEFFKEMPHIAKDLQMMCNIWLWYIKMGQPAHTLSGWESQRLKLVKHLLKSYRWHTLYFLDEPTVWLHPDDIWKLLKVLQKFLNNWDTILMIEHDKNLLKFADNVINLENGKIV